LAQDSYTFPAVELKAQSSTDSRPTIPPLVILLRQSLQSRSVFMIILAVGLFTMAARNAADPDLWWHLRTGQLIAQNHRIFHADPYSFTKLGQPWINHEWLSDVLMFACYWIAGWGGLIVTFGIIIAAAYLLMFWRCPGRPYIAGIMSLWGAFASSQSWGVRPQMFSFLLASIFLLILERSYQHPKLLWWIPPLTWVWVNLHAGYALGITLLILFWVGDLLDSSLRLADQPEPAKRSRLLLAVSALSVVVVPLNPYGFRMYAYPLETLRSSAMQSYISEWASPNFHAHKYLPMLAMLLASILLPVLSRQRLRPRELLMLLAMTFAALLSVRHIPIYVLVAVPILSKLAYAYSQGRGWTERLERTSPVSSTRATVHVMLLCGLLICSVARVHFVIGNQSKVEARMFPESAVSFISAHHLPGQLLNHYNWGGYLIWKLYPEHQVYIDGRADLYGDTFMDEFASTYYLHRSWDDPIKKWGINTVVLPPDAPMISALRTLPGWKQVYGDAQAVILTRSP
jgi:hypothetical protein